MITLRQLLASSALVLGALAAVSNDRHPEPTGAVKAHATEPRRGTPLPQAELAANETARAAHLAATIAHEDDHITALELAAWIRARKPQLRVIDLRTAAEFDDYHLPRAEPMTIESLVATPFQPDETIVLISDGGAHAAQAWVLLETLGNRQVYFLRGGLREWLDDVMNPAIAANASPAETAAFQPVAELSRYFGGVPRVSDATHPPTAVTTSTKAATLAIRRRGC